MSAAQMLQNSFLARDVALERLSELTKNFSGAEIEGLVKDAVAYALNRQVCDTCSGKGLLCLANFRPDAIACA
jgi:SpoVK/Ycf46/Vps4 family AAA+-type ATPase